ncbi:hypothetical protein C7415_1045 [Cupriavidus alkaliphilus]|nr:hypothetical protein C7415_1045 [Cupriavidus alkaliphilus]
MGKLRYLANELWHKLPLTDFRSRFFVETYTEKLRMYTPHFYQARLMNIFSTCEEMIQYVKELQSNDKNSAYLASSIDELESCWDMDTVCQEVLEDLVPLKTGLVKKLKGGDFSANTLHRVNVFCRAVLRRKEVYSNALLISLTEAVNGPVDLTQKDRITTQIDRLTGIYTTHLLYRGYSPTYLYNRAELFFRDNNYGDRDFSSQFRHVTERLQRDALGDFEVVYGIQTQKPSMLLNIVDADALVFQADIPDEIQGGNREKLKKGLNVNVIARCLVQATDYVSAAFRAKERLDRFLDAATALELNIELQVSAHCVVTYQVQNVTHRRQVPVEVLLAFMSSEVGSSFLGPEMSIRQSFKALNDSAADQLGRSLRYLRLARNSASLEQKLLNLWIALESLFINSEQGILSNIVEYVPHFYATAGIWRRVGYLRDLLVENAVATTPLIQDSILPGAPRFDETTTNHQIFALLRNKDAAQELFDSLDEREHLKFKLSHIMKDLKDNKSIRERLARSENDVIRQLRRIYFLRNKIAHTGHFDGVRPQLVTHLLDYVAICYRAISASAAQVDDAESCSIAELLAATRMGVDVVAARVSLKDEVTTLDELILTPIL